MQQPVQQQRGEVVKLFVGQIPKTLEEDGVREVFQEFGDIVEIVILRDRRTNMHQGCCFVKYNSLLAAQSAINTLHNQRSLPPLRNPLQVRFADSGATADRGQTNAENKLFVGGVPTGCGDKELRALFNTYGEVLDVYILASKASQEGQRGCAFVRYAAPQSCTMAIEALHGKYAMKAGELPLVVRYADPPKSQRQNGRMPWHSQPGWPNAPPPSGWPMGSWPMGNMGMGSYPPWAMPGGMGQPGQMPPYGGYYGGQQQYGQSPNSPTQQQHQPQQQQQQAAQAQQAAQQAQKVQQASAPTQPSQPAGPPPTQNAPSSPQGALGKIPPPPPMPPPAGDGGASNGASSLPTSGAHAWTEHLTPEGLKYYYNTSSGTSSWDCPPELASIGLSAGSANHPPLPPLPAGGADGATAALEGAMAACSVGNGGNGFTPSTSAGLPVGMGALPASLNGIASGEAGALPGMGGVPSGGSSGIVVQDWPGAAADLRQTFSQFGHITFCDLDAASSSGRITFESSVHAAQAIEVMNGLAVGEKTLRVSALPF